MNFITNQAEFDAAQEQILDYIDAGRRDDDARIEQLITEIELFVVREMGHHTVLHEMAQLPEEERDEALQNFINKTLNRCMH